MQKTKLNVFNKRRQICVIFIAMIICLMVLVTLPIPATAGAHLPPDGWLGMYINGQKMGYMHMTTERTTFEGRDCYKITSLIRTKIVLLGANVQQDISTVVYASDQFVPYFETFDMTSGGRNTSIEARFGEKEIKCTVKSEGQQSEMVVPIPEGTTLVGDPMYALGGEVLKPGQKAKTNYFNPLRLIIDPVDIEVLREEKVEIKGKTYDTIVVKNATPMSDLTTWQTASGDVVKVTGPMGLSMQTESAAEAVAGVDSDYVPSDDLAVTTSVKSNIDIPAARYVSKLVVRLAGKLDSKLAISDNRQKVTWVTSKDGTRTAEFTIQSTKFDPKKSAKLPIKNAELAKYLKPTPYLQCDSKEIKAKVAEIVGNEKSAYVAASKIRSWVSTNMIPQADSGIPRTALDVLKVRTGVCRDYAVLYAALARAAGIPTKVVAGIEYMDGIFYYHAWAESYVGQWVAFDGTMKNDFVDATHIKLAEGDATDMFKMSSAFGSLKAEIIRFE